MEKRPIQDGEQGLESADVVVGGEKIKTEKPLTEKEKKKLAQKEAKRKRDEMVSNMTKMTEDGLGAFADFMERMTKWVYLGRSYPDGLQAALYLHPRRTPTEAPGSRSQERSLSPR